MKIKILMLAVLCFAIGCASATVDGEPAPKKKKLVDFEDFRDEEAVKDPYILRFEVNEEKLLYTPSDSGAQKNPGIVITPNSGDKPVFTMNEEFGALFAFDRAELSRHFEEQLIDVAAQIRAFRDIRVRIEGYTDAIGTAEYNQGLSERRAKTVADLFLREGVNPAIMSYIGHGKNMPVATNATKEGRAKNRRVEIYVFTYKAP